MCFVLNGEKEESKDGEREQEGEWQWCLEEVSPLWGRV